MWVSEVHLSNVRGFGDTTIQFSKGLNVLVGPNNCGKTTILNSIFTLQMSSLIQKDLRIKNTQGHVNIELSGKLLKPPSNNYKFKYFKYNLVDNSRMIGININAGGTCNAIPSTEPQNFIYPYLSKRKVASYSQDVKTTATSSVTGNFQHLYAKIDNISNPEKPAYPEYTKACDDILGFRVSTTAANNGKEGAYIVDNFDHISLDQMGEGVPNLLGLIVSLCVAEKKLFLIEEPENDIHPKALKKLMELIVKKSSNNQFVITTHSNIVTKYLGAQGDSKIIGVSMNFGKDKIPNSHIEYIDTSEKRIEVLEDLGYELTDFDLWEAWLLLEESSAERIIRDYLIPYFVLELKTKLKTYSSQGFEKIPSKFEDFKNLFVFIHLQSNYKNKAWVIADSGDKEKAIIDDMKKIYSKSGWQEKQFRQFSEHDFERYYPDEFQERATEILSIRNRKENRKQKKNLLNEVMTWCDEDPGRAKAAFEKSAGEVIDVLREIEGSLKKK
ncbi:MAG: AAA family ATPase [Desulfobacula sp.]|nr:AAA family ATPase [Desulfobacula sp.]